MFILLTKVVQMLERNKKKNGNDTIVETIYHLLKGIALQLYSSSFTSLILWLSIKWEEKTLYNISMFSSKSVCYTLPVSYWSSSGWTLSSRASRSRVKWSLLLLSRRTLSIHLILIPIFSASIIVLATFKNNIVADIHDMEDFSRPKRSPREWVS